MKFCELLQEYLRRQAELDEVMSEMKSDAAKIREDTEKICRNLTEMLCACRERYQYLAAYKAALERKRKPAT
jgi:hypothetical protein